MNKRVIGLTAALLTSQLPMQTLAADSNQLASNLCGYVAADNKSRVRKTLKDNGVRLRNIYSDVKCNGLSLLRFAMQSGADQAGTFVSKKLSDKILSAAESDGQTVLQWAEANGHGGTATVAEIKAKLNI